MLLWRKEVFKPIILCTALYSRQVCSYLLAAQLEFHCMYITTIRIHITVVVRV